MNTASRIAQIKTVLENHFEAEECFVFIFGSRASGEAKPSSDWDIGVFSNSRIRPSKMLMAREELEKIRTLNKFDLVDFWMTAPEFRKNAARTILPLIGDSKKWIKKLSETI